jgi:PEP-CTERM motif
VATGPTTLAFYNGDPPFDYVAGLDNVSVSGVPEPSTWALILLGFAGLGLMAHRRKSKASIRGR